MQLFEIYYCFNYIYSNIDDCKMDAPKPPSSKLYFSSAVDLFGKREGFERDYWQLSLKQALEWLLANKKGELHIVVHDHYNHPEQSSYILKANERKRLHIYKDINVNLSCLYDKHCYSSQK
jgi:hypothetical protein